LDKQKLLGQIDGAWRSFQASYEGLSLAQMQAPGAAGDWSVKDVLAHVTTWEEEALKNLPLILDGKRTPRYKDEYGGIDPFNDLMTECKRELSLDQVLQQLETTHRRLLEYVATAPEEQFVTETRFRRRIRWDTYSHYPHHEKAIREWRSRM
jgi:hypothetical protein